MNTVAVQNTESNNQRSEAANSVIYCRVSGKKQTKEGSGLESQEYRCREYAATHGYDVEAVFPGDVSGGGDFMNRPGMVALLAYLDAQADKNYVVIFDDLKRFARDTEFHIKLRREFKIRGATVECLNFRFDDTPEGKFIETVFAAHGALEREQNGRQVVQKMKARVEQGFWVFQAPVGYCYTKSKRGGKTLIRNEPVASIVQEALEGFAAGRFASQAEVQRFLESQPEFPKDSNGKVTQQRAADILTHTIYAGYIGHKNWNVSWVKAQHEALIPLATFEKIQARRKGNAYAPARKDINLDFPLRGFVSCADCNHPFTSCWSKGKYKKYAYYLCDTKGCASYRKSIPRAKIEDGLSDVVQALQPTKSLFALTKAMFKDAWAQRAAQAEAAMVELKQELKAIEKQTEHLLTRIMDASNATVITAYEGKIENLDRKRHLMAEKLHKTSIPNGRFEDFIELSMIFLANPSKLWATGNFTLRRTVLKLAFAEPIPYHRETGYRTPKTTLPFKVLAGISGGNCEMVHPSRFERETSAFGGKSSKSYKRLYSLIFIQSCD